MAGSQAEGAVQVAIRERYGSPADVLALRDVDRPELDDDGVLVRVRAASVNPYDYYVTLLGVPYLARIGAGLRRPKDTRIGVDFAGTVDAVAAGVSGLQPGDEVFGFGTGAFAEYLAVSDADAVTVKPANLTFEEAAAVPTAAVTALQAVRDKGRVQSGQRVLVNGASGGVGAFAVQIARSLGAEVTGVCGTGNVDLVRSLGAEHVVDYTREDITRGARHYDVMIDNVGNHSWSKCRRILADEAICVLVGGRKTNRWLGPLAHWGRLRVAAVRSSQQVVVLLATIDRDDLESIGDMVAAGTLRPVVDRSYHLGDLAEALTYVGGGHARGKVVVTV